MRGKTFIKNPGPKEEKYTNAAIFYHRLGAECFNPSGTGGGRIPPPPSSFFSITQKVINITCSNFVTFNKIDLGIFCQKIKVLGLI